MLATPQAEATEPPGKGFERAPSVYRALVLAIDRRRNQLGLSMIMLDDLAGLQDGYWGKCVHPDTPSGRIAGWQMLQYACDVLFPDGFQLEIRAKQGASLSAVAHKLKVRWGATMKDQRSATEVGREFGLMGASKGGKARASKLSKKRRAEIARKAARARWKYRRRPIKHAPTSGDAP